MSRDAEDPLPPRRPKPAKSGAKPVSDQIPRVPARGARPIRIRIRIRNRLPDRRSGRYPKSRRSRPAARRGPSGSSSAAVSTAHLAHLLPPVRGLPRRGRRHGQDAGEPRAAVRAHALGPVIGRVLLAVRRGDAPGRSHGPGAAGLRPLVPQPDPRRRGAGRRARDHARAVASTTRPGSACSARRARP